MQLMLYHRLLTEIANGEVDPDQVFQRYRLDKDSDFSKTFIDEMSKIDAAITYEDDDVSPDDRRIEIEEHNTLSKVWTLMISEFSNTLTTGRLSPLLSVEYRASNSGEVVGNHSFALDAVELNSYVASEMQWWRGERPARGVEITEASKCSICEFAESCSWRKAKIAQAAATVRSRKAATAATRSNSAPTIP
jgi:exonuclease V